LKSSGPRRWSHHRTDAARRDAGIGTLNRRQIAALAGLTPWTRQSGAWKGKSFFRRWPHGRQCSSALSPPHDAIRCCAPSDNDSSTPENPRSSPSRGSFSPARTTMPVIHSSQTRVPSTSIPSRRGASATLCLRPPHHLAARYRAASARHCRSSRERSGTGGSQWPPGLWAVTIVGRVACWTGLSPTIDNRVVIVCLISAGELVPSRVLFKASWREQPE
jgi:hypothetical protein